MSDFDPPPWRDTRSIGWRGPWPEARRVCTLGASSGIPESVLHQWRFRGGAVSYTPPGGVCVVHGVTCNDWRCGVLPAPLDCEVSPSTHPT